jgi:hypothetical protein
MYRELDAPGDDRVITWIEPTNVQEPLISFWHVSRSLQDDSEVVSDSTLRFRSRDEIAATLQEAGFRVRSVRDAPDRPGLQLVYFGQSVPMRTH